MSKSVYDAVTPGPNTVVRYQLHNARGHYAFQMETKQAYLVWAIEATYRRYMRSQREQLCKWMPYKSSLEMILDWIDGGPAPLNKPQA